MIVRGILGSQADFVLFLPSRIKSIVAARSADKRQQAD